MTNEPQAQSDHEPEPEPSALRLDQFLKLSGIAETGGQAKLLIQAGEVRVNGQLETRRRRKLAAGDVVHFDGADYPLADFVDNQ